LIPPFDMPRPTPIQTVPLDDDAALLRRRRKAARLFAKGGMSLNAIAKEVGVRWHALKGWKKTWDKKGNKGLLVIWRPERRLSDAGLRKIRRMIERGPEAAGYDTGLWTLSLIRRAIATKTGVRYGTTQVWRIMTNVLGFTNQKPETRARERDEKAIAEWKSSVWPTIKKGPKKAKS
jgi:transposase